MILMDTPGPDEPIGTTDLTFLQQVFTFAVRSGFKNLADLVKLLVRKAANGTNRLP